MVECGICLEEYQEGDSELHREMCVARLMFRCSLCTEDYVSKEGLWSHLDQHEIVDESKELHYQDIRVKHKVHQCVLCNDQRAYSESSFWKHVHDVHDGFFLRCADCGEKFRSEKLKNEHADGHCKARDRTVASDFDSLQEEQVPIEVENLTSEAEHLKLSREEQESNANEGLDNRWTRECSVNLNTAANDVDNNIIDKESELPTINSTKSKDLSLQFACDICGIRFVSKCFLLRHKKAKYACMRSRQQKCQHCGGVFLLKEYQAHFRLCEKRQFPCKLCPMKFPTSVRLANHVKRVHRDKGDKVLQNAKQYQNHVLEETIKTTSSFGSKSVISSLNSSSYSNVVEDIAISLSKTDIAEKGVQLLVENPSSTSSDTKCVHCFKEFVSSRYLRKHIFRYHKPSKCSICGITFEGYSTLWNHKKKAHSKSGLKVAAENPSSTASCSKCSHCGIEESSAVTLAHHILIHHDPVACDFCGVTFSSLSQAQDHKKTMHKASKLKCPHCSIQFSTGVRLRAHVSHCKYGKVPCDFCGKKFKNVPGANIHKKKTCPQRSNQQRQQNAESSLCNEAESSTVMDNISPPLVESGLSQTKCYYCYDEFSSPGYLKHHLKVCHELTKCDICGITLLGLTVTRKHKKHCHLGAKYECSTCGRKFHHTHKYTEHRFECEQLNSGESRNKRHRPGENSSKTLELVQDRTQVQNNDLQTEITADDQGQSTVNPSSKIDVSNSGSNEHSLANLNDDKLMNGQGIDEQFPMDSVAPSNDRSERQVVSEKTSQPFIENLPNQPFLCSICGITLQNYTQFYNHKIKKHTEAKFQCPRCSRKFHYKTLLESHLLKKCKLRRRVKIQTKRFHRHVQSNNLKTTTTCNICGITLFTNQQIRYHRLITHGEGNFQCPHCSRKFNYSRRLDEHASRCAGLKHSCELCGHKFYTRKKLEQHRKQVHHGNTPLRNANIECAEEQNSVENLVEKMDAAQEMTSCIICRITCANTDELMKHKETCRKHTHKHDDSQFGAEEISLLDDAEEAQANSTIIVPQGENVELKLEIEVEETVLQEQEYQDPNADPGRSFASSLETCRKHTRKHDDSQFGAEEISLLDDAEKAQANSTITVPQGENVELKLEIEVEETVLQEQEYQDPNADPGSSFASSLKKCHLEAEYECSTCATKFHHEKKYTAHCFECEHLKSGGRRHHPDDSSFETLEIVHDRKQVQNNDLQMEITAEEREDQGLSTVNPSSKVDASNSLANLNDDELMDSQGVDEQSPMVSVAPLNGSKKKRPNQPYTCYKCGITLFTRAQIKYHRLTKHRQGKFQCPHCSRIFHFSRRLNYHVSRCAGFQHSCELCGHKFHALIQLKEHKKKNHHGNTPSRNVSIECANTDELMKHKCMDSQGIDEQSPMVSVAPLNGSSERRVVPEETSQPIVENPPNQSYTCSICGITLLTLGQIKYHRVTTHREGKFQCPHCSRKFHFSRRLNYHVSRCAGFNHLCELCGQKFHSLTQLEEHKKQVHHGNTPLRNANIECAEEQNSVEKMDAAQEMTSCIICRITCANTDELMKHKETCRKHTRKNDDSQFGVEEISLLDDAEEAQANSTIIVPQGENVELKLEIKVEETVLQEQEYQDPNADPGRSFASSLTKYHLEAEYECEQLKSGGSHSKRHHPDDSSFETPEIVQDRKQVLNSDLQMEIIAGERDDLGQSTFNPSSKVDVSNSLANLNDDELLDSQGIDEQSPMVSVAPLNGSSERQVVPEETSQPIVDKRPNQPYTCNICGITLFTRSKFRYHRLTKHGEGKLQCPHCSRKFHIKKVLDEHASRCAGLKHSCELCGYKFHALRQLEEHKKQVHHGNTPSRNANIDCAEEQNSVENLIEKMDAAQELTSCIFCRITCANTDELMKHKVTCRKHTRKHDDSQFGGEEISLLDDVKEAQDNSTVIVPQGENVELKLEIKVEETILQEQEYQDPNADRGRSFATSLHPIGGESKDVEAEDAEDLVNEIKIKEECLEDEEKILTEYHTTDKQT